MVKQDINFENNLNLGGCEIKDVVVEVVSTAPNTTADERAKSGRIVSYEGELYIGDGTKFVKLGDAGDIGDLASRVSTIEGYSSAYTSGIDSTKVAQIGTNATNIGTLQTTVGDSSSGLVKDVGDLKTTVGNSSAGLVKDVADNATAIGTLQSEVETAGTGLLARVTTIEGAYATKVSATAGTGLATINTEGIVTAVTAPTTSDLTDWSTVDAGLVHTSDLINTSAGVADAGKAIKLNSSGKIDNTMIPPLAIAEYVGTVDAKSKLTTLSSAEKGDIAKVEGDSTANNNGIYFLTGAYDTLANWIQIVGPSNVISVNGESGVVVLDASDVGAIDSSYGPETSISDSDAKIPTSKAIKTAVDGKVAKNADITAGTKCKITYDAKGLVTAGADLVASDIPDIAESQVTGLVSDLAGKVAKNADITPVASASFVKVAYDAKGLITGSSAVVASDIPTIQQSQVDGLSTALGDKLDDSQLVTAFGSTPSDSNIPSEKLVKDALDGKVDKVSGKQLSTEDFTSAFKTKLEGIATGAQVNVIETVKVNGTALTPDANKAVDVTVAVLKTATVNTVADTDTSVTGVTAGKTPRCVQVYNSAGEVVMCYTKVASGSLTINTSKAQTGLTVAWME